MKWVTHIRISNEVMDRLGILMNKEERDSLREGVITPDKRRDFTPHQYPHHYGKADVIGSYINSARARYLQSDLPRAYFDLGIALHYVQDSYTSYPSFLPKHQEWEEWIENNHYAPQMEDAILTTIRNSSQRRWYSSLAKQLEMGAQGRDGTIRVATLNERKKDQWTIASPKVDYNLGFRASYIVARSVLGPKDHPPLDIELAKTFISFEEQLIRFEAESSRRLIQLIDERDTLVKESSPTNSFIEKIKNWVARIKFDRADRKAISAKTDYFQRTQMQRIVARYMHETCKLTMRHNDWYISQIPPLDPKSVPTVLVDIGEVSQKLNMSATEVEAAVKDRGLSMYQVEGSRLMKRTDMNILSCPEACPAT